MCYSVFLAQVFGLYMVLTSLAFLIHRDRYKKVIAEFVGNQPLVALSGGLSVLFGLLVVTSHNVWSGDWRILITLVGWFIVLQGVARLFFYERVVALTKQVINSASYLVILCFWLLLGLYLLWMIWM